MMRSRASVVLGCWAAGAAASVVTFLAVMAPAGLRERVWLQLLVPFVGAGVAGAFAPRAGRRDVRWLATLVLPPGSLVAVAAIVVMVLSPHAEPTVAGTVLTLGWAMLGVLAGGWVGAAVSGGVRGRTRPRPRGVGRHGQEPAAR